jgi:hypothetical protein
MEAKGGDTETEGDGNGFGELCCEYMKWAKGRIQKWASDRVKM